MICVITDFAHHGYLPVYYCSKMDRSHWCRGAADARCQRCPALLEAAPYRGQRQPALPFHECGRGGTGRRATLRSLWAKARGSSSLLDRTSLQTNAIRGIACLQAQASAKPKLQKSSGTTLWLMRARDASTGASRIGHCDLGSFNDPDRTKTHNGFVGTDLGGPGNCPLDQIG